MFAAGLLRRVWCSGIVVNALNGSEVSWIGFWGAVFKIGVAQRRDKSGAP